MATTNKPIRVLLIDDEQDDAVIVREMMSRYKDNPFEITWTADVDEATEAMTGNKYDVFLLDNWLGHHSGTELLRKVIAKGCNRPVVLMTGQGSRDLDMEALQIGAADYLDKGHMSPETLERSLRYSIEQFNIRNRLYESEQNFRTLFEKLIDAAYVTDADGRFVSVNDAMLELFNCKEEVFLAMQMKDLFHREDDRKWFQEQLSNQDYVRGFETLLSVNGQEPIACIISANKLFSADPKQGRYQGIIHDITKLKKAEQDLISAEKMAVTGLFARTIAHEVRNPLTNIQLSLEQIEEDFGSDKRLHTYTDIIWRNCKRINELIIHLMDSSKPSELMLQSYELNRVVQEVLELVADRAKLTGVNVLHSFTRQNTSMTMDVRKVSTALLNIVLNSLEALPERNGVLKVSTKVDGQLAKVIIEDNGRGIAADKLPRLFEPFFSEKRGGMGLGLTTAYNYVKSHDGDIKVQSTLGKGTRFTVQFPLKQHVKNARQANQQGILK